MPLPREYVKAKKGYIFVGVSAVVLVLVIVIILKIQTSLPRMSVTENRVQSQESSPFQTTKNELPPDFPSNIPIENGSKMTQGDSKDYGDQKQLTIVFNTAKTIEQNFTLYSDFLGGDGWSMRNKYKDKNIASLYGTKQGSNINITISTEQVSIAILKK